MRNTRTPGFPLETGHPPPRGGGSLATTPFAGNDFFSPRFSLLDQLFIIRAIILRGLSLKYRKTRVGFMMEFFQPIVIILVHVYVFAALMRFMPGEIPVELFVLGGFTTWFTLSHIARGGMNPRTGPAAMFIPGITPMHFRIAAAAWEYLAMVLLCFVGVALAEAFRGDIPPPDVAASVMILFVTAVLGFGFRLVFDALGTVWPTIKGLKKMVLWFWFLTGGVYFSMSNVSHPLATVAMYDPLLHLIESQRHALYPGYPVAQVTMLYPIAWALGLTLAGLLLNRCVLRWVHH